MEVTLHGEYVNRKAGPKTRSIGRQTLNRWSRLDHQKNTRQRSRVTTCWGRVCRAPKKHPTAAAPRPRYQTPGSGRATTRLVVKA